MNYHWLLFGYLLVLARILNAHPKSQVSVSSSAAASVKYPPPGSGGSPQAYISSLSSAKADPHIPVTVNDGAAEEKPKTTWAYHPSDTAYGPENWFKIAPQCAGKHQSPINIVTANVAEKPFDSPMQLNAGGDPDAPLTVSGKLVNNGKTIGFNVNPESPIVKLSGAALGENSYKFRQFHLHFGCAGTKGSEHALDGQKFAGELHLVFVNEKYTDAKLAMQQKDGLAILAFFIQSNPNAPKNPALQKVALAIANIAKPKDQMAIPTGINIKALVPNLNEGIQNLRRYAYRGSIPTPPCFESVTWIVFRRPLQVTPDKIEQVKKARGDDFLSICGKARPVQSLNDRVVYSFVRPPTTLAPSSTRRSTTVKRTPSFAAPTSRPSGSSTRRRSTTSRIGLPPTLRRPRTPPQLG